MEQLTIAELYTLRLQAKKKAEKLYKEYQEANKEFHNLTDKIIEFNKQQGFEIKDKDNEVRPRNIRITDEVSAKHLDCQSYPDSFRSDYLANEYHRIMDMYYTQPIVRFDSGKS